MWLCTHCELTNILVQQDVNAAILEELTQTPISLYQLAQAFTIQFMFLCVCVCECVCLCVCVLGGVLLGGVLLGGVLLG